MFVEDSAVVYGDLAVIARPGADERKPETDGTEKALAGLGYRIARIEAPGTLDGGDVLKHGGTVWVGLGGRTNQAGVDQLRDHLAPLGATVVGVPVTKVLHLKSAVTALPDGTVVGHDPLVDDPTVFPAYLSVPEEPGAHVVLLDGSTVLMSTSAPRTPGALRGARAARGRRRHLRVREARGLRDLPVDPAPRLSGGSEAVRRGLRRHRGGAQPGVEEAVRSWPLTGAASAPKSATVPLPPPRWATQVRSSGQNVASPSRWRSAASAIAPRM